MGEIRKERADAVRNRRAILAATEKLLAAHRAADISIEQVADEAGVAKGTVFHRFGSRTGLMTALMYERAQALSDAIADGPPPLGPGAPDQHRLFAFLDAVIDMIARNKSLLTELARAPETVTSTETETTADSGGKPVYSFWHTHLRTLLATQRSDVDADLIAHLVLGSLHSEPVLARLTSGGPERIAAALRTMVQSLLDAPSPLPVSERPAPNSIT
jgi:AcrR family transcriptional regulator